MGGFIILPREAGQTPEHVEARHAACLDVFNKKGLTRDRLFQGEGFVAIRYNKLFKSSDAWLDFPAGDFIFSTGTFIYDGKLGGEALKSFFDDYVNNKPFEERCSGNFALVIHHKGALSVITDYCGYYPIYCHESSKIVTSSFLASAKISVSHRIDRQAMYEYFLHGFFVGGETLFEGIHRLDSRKLWQVLPKPQGFSRTPAFIPLPASCGFDEIVESISAQLHDYFLVLARLFQGSIGSALSGGYDSRHMTALLLSVGESPHLYVYGSSSSSDVRVALNIARGEGLEIEHTDKSAFPRVGPDEFAVNVERDFYFFDGIKPLGQIDDGSDMMTRLSRARKAQLQLNGAGGEIYREIWNLSDRSIDLESFLRLRYDRGEYSFLRPPFNSREYFSGCASKVKKKLLIDRSRIARNEAEMLFPFLRNQFASCNNLANSQISDSLLPFMEARFVMPSANIPIRYKYCGDIHAALLRKAWPPLAAYQSDYGINFANSAPLPYRARRAIDRDIPLFIRMLARKYRPVRTGSMPYYLESSYLKSCLDLESMRVNDYVDIAGLDEPELLSRALSIELLLRHVH